MIMVPTHSSRSIRFVDIKNLDQPSTEWIYRSIIAKLYYFIFYPLEGVYRNREPQLQVGEQ